MIASTTAIPISVVVFVLVMEISYQTEEQLLAFSPPVPTGTFGRGASYQEMTYNAHSPASFNG